jgi:mannose-6-phosphate isomerase-like protein (cupin superfamily)
MQLPGAMKTPGGEEGEMKYFLSAAALFTMVVGLAPSSNSAGGGVPAAVHYIDRDKVAVTMAKGGAIVSDPGLIVLAQHRGAGPAEYHERTNHVFIMVEGDAIFVTGGTLVDAKRTAPYEMRATAIQGGETHHLSKGDVITIPAKTPHWWKEVSSNTVSYYAVNIESQ